MDIETLFWVVIIFVGVIWNLITKILQRISSPLPQQDDNEVRDYLELSPGDLHTYQEAASDSGRTSPKDYDRKISPSVTYLVKEKKEVPLPVTVPSSMDQKRARKCGQRNLSVQKLQQAVIWSEILARPKALRENE